MVKSLFWLVIEIDAQLHYELFKAQVSEIQQIVDSSLLLVDQSHKRLYLLLFDVLNLIVPDHLDNLR